MSLESRSRMISVRVTNEEYERFRELCFSQGMQSVSELARSALNMLSDHPSRLPSETVEARIRDVEGRLQWLTQEVKKIACQNNNGAGNNMMFHAKNGSNG